jgi:hemolysin activation/secretion protein
LRPHSVNSSVPAARGRGARGRALSIAVTVFAAAWPVIAQDAPRIRRIQIVSENVFQDAEGAFLARVADAIHGVTRPEVINRELLFAEGEVLDPAKLAETERNLRALGLFRSVKIRTVPVGDGDGDGDEVDIVVETRDGWTTQVNGSIGRAGGHNKFGAEIEENNLLGLGKSLAVSYASNPDRDTRAISYQDPQFLGRRLNLDLLYASLSDGDRQRFSLSQPFRSLETLAAGAVVYDTGRQSTRIYEAGSEVARFATDSDRFEISAGRKIWSDTIRPIARITAGYRREATTFGLESGDPADLPTDRNFGFFFGRLDLLQPAFIVDRGIYSFSRDEDIDLGSNASLEVAYSPFLFGSEEQFSARLQVGRGYAFSSGFLLGALSAKTRVEPGGSFVNSLAEGSLIAVWRPAKNSPQTVIGRVLVTWGSDLDRDFQLEADGATGLRGYKLHAFTGDRRLLLNLEDRVRLTRELLHLFEIGAAAFVDAGYAWPVGAPASLADLRTDVGVGLRIALPRAPRLGLFRLDLAYALRPDLQGRRGFLVSFSSSQAF